MTQQAVFLLGMACCALVHDGPFFINGGFFQGMNIAVAVLALNILADKVNTLPVFPVNLLVAAFTGDRDRLVLAVDMPT